MTTQSEMFGCDPVNEMEYIKTTLTYKFSGAAMVITSLLSDAQHLVEYGNNERARQIMNFVKYLVNNAEFMSHQGE